MFQTSALMNSGHANDASPAAEVLRLIGRYPDISEVEIAQLINLYRKLPALELALMISDERLAPKLDRFVADHRSQFRVPFRQYAALVAIALGGLAVVMWVVGG